MAITESYKEFVLDQLTGLGKFETKNMFGGVALLYQGSAFAKIKHDKVWLKVDETNQDDFVSLGMKQYSYGKDNSRKLNFFETPIDVIENKDKFLAWAKLSMEIAKK